MSLAAIFPKIIRRSYSATATFSQKNEKTGRFTSFAKIIVNTFTISADQIFECLRIEELNSKILVARVLESIYIANFEVENEDNEVMRVDISESRFLISGASSIKKYSSIKTPPINIDIEFVHRCNWTGETISKGIVKSEDRILTAFAHSPCRTFTVGSNHSQVYHKKMG